MSLDRIINSCGISVCIPARNEEKTIAAAVTSVLKQNYPAPIEVIVCANGRKDQEGCSDQTEDIVSRIAQSDNRVKLATSKAGKPNAWNKLMAESKYENLLFMDGDTVICEGSLLALYKTIKKSQDYILSVGNLVKLTDHLPHISRILAFPKVIPGTSYVCGRMYLLDKKKFLARMNEKGYYEMPRDIINEDCWVGLIAKDKGDDSMPNARIGYTKAARAYFLPVVKFNELYKERKRIASGHLQIQFEHPHLGYTYDEGINLMLHKKIKRWYLKWKELDGVSEKLTTAFAFLVSKIVLLGVSCYAYRMARNEYFQGMVTNLWDITPSSKQGININSISI